MSHRNRLILSAVTFALPVASFASAHDDGNAAAEPGRGAASVTIVEHEDRTDSSTGTLRLKRGDIARFDVTNADKIDHEFPIDHVPATPHKRP